MRFFILFLIGVFVAGFNVHAKVMTVKLEKSEQQVLQTLYVNKKSSLARQKAVLKKIGDVAPFTDYVRLEEGFAKSLAAFLKHKNVPLSASAKEEDEHEIPQNMYELCLYGKEDVEQNISHLDENIIPSLASQKSLLRELAHLREMYANLHLPAFEACVEDNVPSEVENDQGNWFKGDGKIPNLRGSW